jgi:hypothetical protein
MGLSIWDSESRLKTQLFHNIIKTEKRLETVEMRFCNGQVS